MLAYRPYCTEPPLFYFEKFSWITDHQLSREHKGGLLVGGTSIFRTETLKLHMVSFFFSCQHVPKIGKTFAVLSKRVCARMHQCMEYDKAKKGWWNLNNFSTD